MCEDAVSVRSGLMCEIEWARNCLPVEHLVILGVVLIYMLIIVIAVWHVRDVELDDFDC